VVDLIAFLDESRKPTRSRETGRAVSTAEHYVVAAAVVIEGDLDRLRAQVRDVESSLGYRLHYSDLRSRERRVDALQAIAGIPDWDAFVFETDRALPLRNNSEHHVRSRILSQAFLFLGRDLGVSHVVLETRSAPARGFDRLDRMDHQSLQSLRDRRMLAHDLRISHATKSEPLLAIADLVAGARSDELCWADRGAFPLVAHRVESIAQVVARGAETQRPRDYES
jgi:hypothetical protein